MAGKVKAPTFNQLVDALRAESFEVASSSAASNAVQVSKNGVAAILAPAALSTLNVTFTQGRERGRAFGIYAAIASGGAVVGLLLGGALTEWLSWRVANSSSCGSSDDWINHGELARALPRVARRRRGAGGLDL